MQLVMFSQRTVLAVVFAPCVPPHYVLEQALCPSLQADNANRGENGAEARSVEAAIGALSMRDDSDSADRHPERCDAASPWVRLPSQHTAQRRAWPCCVRHVHAEGLFTSELRIETPGRRDYSSEASLLLSGGLSTKTHTRRVYESLCHRVQHLDGPPVVAGCVVVTMMRYALK